MLRVRRMSMIKVGIFEDDPIAVLKIDQALNGEIIVAQFGEDVTVKRDYKESNMIRLVDYEDIIVNLMTDDFTIEGKYVGGIRNTVH